MFIANSWIHLADTDVTGVIFYPKLLEKCLFAFESFIREKIGEHFLGKVFLFPVVHVEMDFVKPLYHMDQITIELEVQKLGNSSVTLHYKIVNAQKEVSAMALITHVLVDKNSREKHLLTDEIKSIFLLI